MAKASKKKGAAKPAVGANDERTAGLLVGLANQVAACADSQEDPRLAVPSRTLSNVSFNKGTRMIELGGGKNYRQLFNLAQAKAYMQTMLVASGCKQLIDEGKTTSIRGLFYLLKHSIENSKEETFADQSECDPIIEDVEVMLNALREELHVYASNRGNMVGPLTLIDSGDTIDCSRLGSGGYSIPSIVEEGSVDFVKCTADFILHVEKDTVWRRFNEDKFWKRHNCLLTHGGGQPARGVRRLLSRLHHEYKLPVLCLLDNDPWGYYIYSVLKQGSINLAYESKRMAIPNAKFLGLRARDYERCGLSSSVKIKLNDTDVKRAKQIAGYPWFKDKRAWQHEINTLLKNGFKLEVEALISKSISYVTEQFVPELLKLGERDWLD